MNSLNWSPSTRSRSTKSFQRKGKFLLIMSMGHWTTSRYVDCIGSAVLNIRLDYWNEFVTLGDSLYFKASLITPNLSARVQKCTHTI